MEAAEDATLEAAIGWLVQTILGSLLIDKLDAWIRRAGLSIDIERLKSEVERVEMVVAAVRGRASGYKPLTRPLARLKELLYDADDVIDELDYYRLQQQVQGVTWEDPEGMHGAERVDERSMADADIRSSSGGKKRSKAWDDFEITEEENGKPMKAKCKYCHRVVKCGTDRGTSVLHNHVKSNGCLEKRGATDQPPNPSTSTRGATANATPVAIGNSSSRKRRRTDEESAQITSANTHRPWNKAEISNKIQELTRHLQDTGGEVSEILKIPGPNFANSSHCRSTTSDQHLRTSGLLQRKMYGRAEEKESIIKLMREHKSGGVTVLPIVGVGGVGKTALAQLVYNDPTVEKQFDHRIWVWLSNNFDETRLSTEMLDFFPQETHKGMCSFAKPQEVLNSHIKSKRVLLVLDDVWDDMNYGWWNQLLAPFKYDNANGNVILVTTRKLSVAKRIGTVGPIKLGSLGHDDFWLLFKSCAFGDGNYGGPGNLSTIGRQIAAKLKGNPLAAVTVGALLRDHLTIDHWSNILKKENWKSLGLSGGIMPALKRSYDQLPHHLQQCFSYCSIFPYNYPFLGEELVYIWISQGFVNCNHFSKRLEEIGRDYLTELVNLGFFQQVENKYFFGGNQTRYAICGLMHDLAMLVSRTECATIDNLQCNEMLPTIRHLSIVTDQHELVLCNEKFEKQLLTVLRSVRKLRTLVLIGQYDPQCFPNLFKEAENLRVLQVSAKTEDYLFQHNVVNLTHLLVNPTHLRYINFKAAKEDGTLRQVLSKFCHLQVLHVGSCADRAMPDGTNSFVNLRHLVAEEGMHSSIASIGDLTSLLELHGFKVQDSRGFEITQLQSMNELVQLGVSQLENVKSREEAHGAGLRNKQHLEKLHLSWKHTSSDGEYHSEELLPMDDSDPSPEPSMDTAREVLEGLEPHPDLKHLEMSGYNGTTSPTWLANNVSVTSLQTLHLDNCGKWQILPPLERLQFLTKLTLSNLRKVTQVSVPSLEELVLVKMPKLWSCSCTSVEGLNSSLRVLQIEKCQALKVFDLLENYSKFEIEQMSWLSGLRKLILCNCPRLEVSSPLPPSITFSLISGVSTLSKMEGSCSEMLRIGSSDKYSGEDFDESCDELRILDDKILAFHDLRTLKLVIINGCRNLTSISFKGFSQLVSLKRLEIYNCKQLFSSHVFPERTCEDMPAANCIAFPSLERLTIWSCGIAGKWLPLMLRHAPELEELILDHCPHVTTLLSIEKEANSLSNLITARVDSSSGNPTYPFAALARDALLHILLNPISSLKKITVRNCPRVTCNGSKDGFSEFTALQKLDIWGCPESLVHEDGSDDQANCGWLLPQSLGELEIHDYSPETLQPCFPLDHTSLKKLEVQRSPGLESLQLHSCTALEELIIINCQSLTTLQGSLRHLKALQLHLCPSLPPCLESISRAGYKLCPWLQTLDIDDPSVLTTSFCKHLTSLRRLKLYSEATRLTNEQERALVLLKSLQELEFFYCDLVDLPAGLHTLLSLKRLEISSCWSISRLPKTGLPLSLEELAIVSCSKDLEDQCKLLATSKLHVKIVR